MKRHDIRARMRAHAAAFLEAWRVWLGPSGRAFELTAMAGRDPDGLHVLKVVKTEPGRFSSVSEGAEGAAEEAITRLAALDPRLADPEADLGVSFRCFETREDLWIVRRGARRWSYAEGAVDANLVFCDIMGSDGSPMTPEGERRARRKVLADLDENAGVPRIPLTVTVTVNRGGGECSTKNSGSSPGGRRTTGTSGRRSSSSRPSGARAPKARSRRPRGRR